MRESVRALSATSRFAEIVLAGPAADLEPLRTQMQCPVRVIDMHLGRHDPRLVWRWSYIAEQVGRPHCTWFPHWDGTWRVFRGNTAPVTTLHDLIQLDGEGICDAVRSRMAEQWMARMMTVSRRVITGTHHASASIVERFPNARDKVRVVPHGVAPTFFVSAPPTAHMLHDAGVEGPFLLAVANKKPHKNLEMAIRVFARLATADPRLQLVLVGDRFPYLSALMGLAQRLGVAERVVDLAAIPEETLIAAYAHAEVLIFPSRLEGFGLPMLEAMAAGAPVVAVDAPPIPEVVGDAAVLVPMDDDAAMAAAVTRLRAEARWRADRVEAGRARAAQFTWERSARTLADVLCG